MAFDSNAMTELKHLAADRYQRAGGGGATKVYLSSQAFYTARGYHELSPFSRACLETLHRYRQACEISAEHFRIDCLTSKEGFYHGDSIPF